MSDQRLGAAIRLLRTRRGWRQWDLAVRAGISQSTVSRMERGHFDAIRLYQIRGVAKVLDIRVDLVGRWRAGDLDRMLNLGHSQLHESVARTFAKLLEWTIAPEVSFSVYGERGVIDILAWHAGHRALLVIELKTDIVDANELVGTADRRRRLAIQAARGRSWNVEVPGLPPPRVSLWVIVAPGRTNRRRITNHQAMLRAAYPSDGRAMAGWLRRPRRPIAALSTWPDMRAGTLGTSRGPVRRVVRPPKPTVERGSTRVRPPVRAERAGNVAQDSQQE